MVIPWRQGQNPAYRPSGTSSHRIITALRRNIRSTAGLSSAPISNQSVLLRETAMNGIIYLIGLVVVILAILSFLGLR